ncbi:MAG: glycosyltransferase family 4 protein [Pigmentiphaga sp.]|nr:glycosyltransferase family 4 protein [Pigmentiphaga sp.]
MNQTTRPRVLFGGTEFRQQKQRGIYFYAKSAIAAVRAAGYDTTLLTEARDNEHKSLLLSRIYHTLHDPVEHRPNRPRMLARYLEQRVLRRHFAREVAHDAEMLTEEHLWFLRNFSSFLNVPRIYDTIDLATRLPFSPPVDLSFAADHGQNVVFTTAPTHVRARHRRVKLVQTVHDVIPLQVTLQSDRPDQFFRATQSAVRYSDMLLAMSEYTRDRLVDLFPQAAGRVKVVYQSIPADERLLRLSEQPLVQQAVLSKFGLSADQYCFYIGAIEPRKNIHRLITAHQVVAKHADCPLILAGPVNKRYAADHGMREQLGVGRRSPGPSDPSTRYIGYVTEIEKLCLLRNARFFAFPTLSEGFGIPVLEAQTLGCPVLTSNTSSIPEVVGSSAALIEDPYSVEEIASRLQRLLEDGEYRQQLRRDGLVNAQRFSQQSFSSQLDAALREL